MKTIGTGGCSRPRTRPPVPSKQKLIRRNFALRLVVNFFLFVLFEVNLQGGLPLHQIHP